MHEGDAYRSTSARCFAFLGLTEFEMPSTYLSKDRRLFSWPQMHTRLPERMAGATTFCNPPCAHHQQERDENNNNINNNINNINNKIKFLGDKLQDVV